MKLQSTVTVTTREEKEVDLELPYHCMVNDHYTPQYLRVESEAKVVHARRGNGYGGVSIYPVDTFKKEILTGTPITEAEFMEAYNKCMEAVKVEKVIYSEIDFTDEG